MRRKYQRSLVTVAGWVYGLICLFELLRYFGILSKVNTNFEITNEGKLNHCHIIFNICLKFVTSEALLNKPNKES